jgi:hypothetical protein
MDVFEAFLGSLLALVVFFGVLGFFAYRAFKTRIDEEIERIQNPLMLILPENGDQTGMIYDSQGPLFTTPPPDPSEPDISPEMEDVPDRDPDDLIPEEIEFIPSPLEEEHYSVVTDLWIQSRLTQNQFDLWRQRGHLFEVTPEDGEARLRPPVYRIHPEVMTFYDEQYRTIVGAYG